MSLWFSEALLRSNPRGPVWLDINFQPTKQRAAKTTVPVLVKLNHFRGKSTHFYENHRIIPHDALIHPNQIKLHLIMWHLFSSHHFANKKRFHLRNLFCSKNMFTNWFPMYLFSFQVVIKNIFGVYKFMPAKSRWGY